MVVVDQKWVLKCEMPDSMRDAAVGFVLRAVKGQSGGRPPSEIAAEIKRKLDGSFGAPFHVIVGREFGCRITGEVGTSLLLTIDGLSVLVFKAGDHE